MLITGLGSMYWHGWSTFGLAVLILAGETVNTLLVLPSLFHTATHVQLPA